MDDDRLGRRVCLFQPWVAVVVVVITTAARCISFVVPYLVMNLLHWDWEWSTQQPYMARINRLYILFSCMYSSFVRVSVVDVYFEKLAVRR